MPTDADIDFLFSAYPASPSREYGGLEWGDRAVWGTSTTGTRTRSGWINEWKRMSYRDTFFALESSNQMQHLGVVNLVRCSVAQAFARPAVELIVHLQHPPFADIV